MADQPLMNLFIFKRNGITIKVKNIQSQTLGSNLAIGARIAVEGQEEYTSGVEVVPGTTKFSKYFSKEDLLQCQISDTFKAEAELNFESWNVSFKPVKKAKPKKGYPSNEDYREKQKEITFSFGKIPNGFCEKIFVMALVGHKI